jgi:hypothetical protein
MKRFKPLTEREVEQARRNIEKRGMSQRQHLLIMAVLCSLLLVVFFVVKFPPVQKQVLLGFGNTEDKFCNEKGGVFIGGTNIEDERVLIACAYLDNDWAKEVWNNYDWTDFPNK